jgi:hypothetical protein
VRTDISWSTDPDDWEAARAELADIIESASACPDFGGDGIVNLEDLQTIAALWGTATSDPRFDRDGDGRITVRDVMLVARRWGDSCSL